MKTESTRERKMIAIGQLRRSPLNVRKASASGIEELASLIAAQGVLQNLTVVKVASKAKKPVYGVVAGGRRLAALQHLVKQKTFPASRLVPCLIVDEAEAVEVSMAENSGREDMHPADQFEAFSAMIEAGRSIEDVAARFGLAPITVQRRLKLANVAPRFLAMYRADELDTDALMALALVDDHEKQEAVWDGLEGWQRHARAIRTILTEGQVANTDRLAKFVGLKAYEKAGGAVERDLFSEADACFLADPALLHKLVAAKLERAANKVKAEGAAWVEVAESMDYSERAAFGQVRERLRKATDEEQAEIDRLENELREVEASIQATDDDDVREPLWDRESEIEEALGAIEEARSEPDPEQQALGGAVVTIDYSGKLEVIRNLLRPADAKAFERAARQGRESAATEAFSAGHSEAMLRRLDAHRTRALQVELMRRPDVALQALVQSLLVGTFYHQPWLSVAGISGRSQALENDARDLPDSEAEKAAQAVVAKWQEALPRDVDQLWPWLQHQSQGTLLELLACCLSETVNAIRNRAGESPVNVLADAVGLDMHQWWRPTADAYFQALPKARILGCLAEIDPEGDASAASKMKKAALAEHAAERTEAGGWKWLPEPMRSSTD